MRKEAGSVAEQAAPSGTPSPPPAYETNEFLEQPQLRSRPQPGEQHPQSDSQANIYFGGSVIYDEPLTEPYDIDQRSEFQHGSRNPFLRRAGMAEYQRDNNPFRNQRRNAYLGSHAGPTQQPRYPTGYEDREWRVFCATQHPQNHGIDAYGYYQPQPRTHHGFSDQYPQYTNGTPVSINAKNAYSGPNYGASNALNLVLDYGSNVDLQEL